jgi:uncharacterized protein GlcG (DUF336 family)
MQTKKVLSADDVKKIAHSAEAEAKKNSWAVTIAIVDDGGHLLWLQRLDGAAPVSAYIGTEKARASAIGRRARPSAAADKVPHREVRREAGASAEPAAKPAPQARPCRPSQAKPAHRSGSVA